jgi:hypothetical protein
VTIALFLVRRGFGPRCRTAYSTVVRQRTAEIGIRVALGASPSGIFGQMIVYGLRLSAARIMIGLLATCSHVDGLDATEGQARRPA